MTAHHTTGPLKVTVGLMVGLLMAKAAVAAPVGDEACGDGSKFTVSLPAVGSTVGDDTITLPNGCRIYALLVSGYERNKAFDELTFYNLAKFVMENDGYV